MAMFRLKSYSAPTFQLVNAIAGIAFAILAGILFVAPPARSPGARHERGRRQTVAPDLYFLFDFDGRIPCSSSPTRRTLDRYAHAPARGARPSDASAR